MEVTVMKRRTLKALELMILIVGLMLMHEIIVLVFESFIAGMLAYGLWMAAVLVVGHYTNQLRLAQLRRLRGLADELGLDARAIAHKAPRYSASQWQASRPENLQFFPAAHTVADLCDQLTLLVATRTGVC
ncbi:hypothetical protein FD01_GL002557 [Lacticaseibacillus manihotivorans DSM 13343 = JCM 12514]|uniref:Uncharacterized protein n=2 Tax=Lacticaseibacillus manihotivorans TaxID=88233 RepID=A0A0R1QEN8_9LACO|nr:hypothetical protein FD01_GL002557 [Lacticaseibacillus manihotivorans DSM 13343 = JCM 12514]